MKCRAPFKNTSLPSEPTIKQQTVDDFSGVFPSQQGSEFLPLLVSPFRLEDCLADLTTFLALADSPKVWFLDGFYFGYPLIYGTPINKREEGVFYC